MKKRNPRHGSMQFWPRKKSKSENVRVRTWKGDKGLLGFAGYKVGMTHLMITDNKTTTKTKGKEIFMPATIIECPPLKVVGVRFYKNSVYGSNAVSQITAEKLDKELAKRISLPKNKGENKVNTNEIDDVTLVVHTQPKLTGLGKKRPEIFEIALGGNKEEKLNYSKEKLGKEVSIEEIFNDGDQLDIHGVTKGKGYQGPVKRFGVNIRAHKSEKTRRGPGSLGGWKGQGHVMYRVAHAGQTGFHKRTEYNKWIVKISKDSKEVEQKGGFLKYGVIKNPYIILKGSVIGPRKRLIKFGHAIRPAKNIPKEAPAINYISRESKQ